MIYFKSEQIRERFMSSFVGDLSLESLIENAKKNNETIGYLDSVNSELKIAINDDYAYIDDMGELEEARGRFEKFLELNSSVTELEKMLSDYIHTILNCELDIVCLGKIRL